LARVGEARFQLGGKRSSVKFARLKLYLRAYLPVVLWMLSIYGASTDAGNTRNTSRIIGPIVRWIYPEISEEALSAVVTAIRKSAHIGVYAVLAALAWRGQRVVRGNWREWRWAEFWGILAFCFAYAVSDELHQTFVSSRQGQLTDVMFDTTGAVLALLLIRWATLRWGRPKAGGPASRAAQPAGG
jgi:VanZ family protein